MNGGAGVELAGMWPEPRRSCREKENREKGEEKEGEEKKRGRRRGRKRRKRGSSGIYRGGRRRERKLGRGDGVDEGDGVKGKRVQR